MLLAAQMGATDAAARGIFDGITKYVLDHPSSIDADLHAAEQDAQMASHNGADSATDGDMDIAMAHLMAHARWGSAGTYDYQALALRRIAAIKRSVISSTTGLLELGDWSSGSWLNVSRPSDWMLGHFEAFARATGETAWEDIRAAHMAAVKRLQDVHAPATGLLPDFTVNPPATVAPAPAGTLESPNDGSYYYNACRIPWRLGASGRADSRAAAARISAWAQAKTAGVPSALSAGFRLDGTAIDDAGQPAPGGFAYSDHSFIAPMLVAAAAAGQQSWLDALWTYEAANIAPDYYPASIQLLCMILVSGTYALAP